MREIMTGLERKEASSSLDLSDCWGAVVWVDVAVIRRVERLEDCVELN